MVYFLECPDCGNKSDLEETMPLENWKDFNSVTCPVCFRNINLPWCRPGFEAAPREPTLIIQAENSKDLAKYIKSLGKSFGDD